jgi:GTP-binding protein EngB required for normal cell division
MKDEDHQLIEWALAAGWKVHALLAKADKLNQRERSAALKQAQSELPDGVSAQVFSAHDNLGVEAAQKALLSMLS